MCAIVSIKKNVKFHNSMYVFVYAFANDALG